MPDESSNEAGGHDAGAEQRGADRSDSDRPGAGAGAGDGVEYAVVAGYGPVGRTVCQSLERRGVNVTVVEMNPATVERQAEQGRTFVFGDATDQDILLAAGVKHAQVLVLAIPDEDQAWVACRVARSLNPSVFILARANFLSKGMLCTRAGADQVIVEELVTAQAMHDAVMRQLGHG